jgi:tetratricopeptide (TPR) repeat protein
MGSGADKAANAAEIDRLALALAKEPGSKAFIPLAEEYGKAGMWDEAVAVLEDGLKAYPNFITAMVALGRTYDQIHQPVKATAILEEAVKLSPENLSAHRTLAKLYAAQGQKDVALRSCRVILAVNPQDQEALSMCAMLETASSHTVTEQSTPPPTVGLGLSTPENDVVSGKTQERPSPRVVQAQHMESSADKQTVSLGQKSAAVAQLEQWLTSIRSRRLDQGVPPDQTA